MSATDDRSSFPFDKEIQYHILRMMMTSESFLVKCGSYLKSEYFEDAVLAWFFNAMLRHYADFRKKVELVTLKNELLKVSAEQRFTYERVLEKIEASGYTDEEYLRKELTGWLRSRKFIKLHTKIADLFNDNQRESAYDVTLSAINEIKQVDFIADKTTDFANVDQIIEKVAQASNRCIPTGIPDFDNAMAGGLPRQGLTTVLGGTNAGKSVMLMNLTYNAAIQDYKVLYIYHEGRDDQTALRLLSRFSGVPYIKFYGGLASLDLNEQQRVLAAKKVLSENIILKPWRGFNVTVDDVIGYCTQKKSEFNFDMMVCDYGQLLSVKNVAKELRHNMALVYRGLSSLAEELDIVGVTAAQGNRSAQIDIKKGKKLMSMTDISECFEIARCSEAVITLTRSEQDEHNNRMKALLDKQRDGPTNIAVECVTDLKRMVMYDRRLGIFPLQINGSQEVTDDGQTQSNGLSAQVSA